MNLEPDVRADEARRRLESWRSILLRVEVDENLNLTEEAIAELLGSASVATMAEIESFVRTLIESITDAINHEKCLVRSLRPELRVLHAQGTFDSIQRIGKQHDEYWQRRIDVAYLHESNDIASLPAKSDKQPQAPLRGSTIALRDLSTAAQIFGFPHPGRLVGNSRLVTSLRKLATYRNDYAHAKLASLDMFPNPRKELRTIVDHLSCISDLFDILAEEWEAVVTDKLYLDATVVNGESTPA